MNQKKIQKRLSLLFLIIPVVCFALDPQPPKSTKEILKKNANTQQEDLWEKLEGIPTVDPIKHSDGCSGGMSATYAKLEFLHVKYGKTLPWRQCCVVHDRAYYYGGIEQEKNAADIALKKCVTEVVGNKNLGLILGALMKNAVWIGGIPYFPTTYRWGYGEDFRGTENLPAND